MRNETVVYGIFHRLLNRVMFVMMIFTAVSCSRLTDGYKSDMYPYDLTCEYLTNPLGIDEVSPRLSWKLEAEGRSRRQSAYRVIVASSQEKIEMGTGDLWDSGPVESDRSVQVVYEGSDLESRQKCWWRVMVWDESNLPGTWSEPAIWEMSLLNGSDWTAEWIASAPDEPGIPPTEPAPMFRKEFPVTGSVVSARAYVTGLGYYELSVNGERVGNHRLDPVKSRYDRRIYYATYDVTQHIREGSNAAGILLGTGWYNMHTRAVWGFEQAPWRARPRVLVRIEVTYQDGTGDVIISDGTWRVSTGPIVFDAIRNGETYDARHEQPGWDTAGFDESGWNTAVVVQSPGGELSAQMLPPIKDMQTLKPVSVSEVQPGVFVYDLGQNIAGVCELRVSGTAGTRISMKQGERLYPDGTVEQKQIARFIRSGELQTDTYICKGTGTEIWRPRFVYHGFQYIEVRGYPGIPTVDDLSAHVMYTAFGNAGSFNCSLDLFNQIQHATQWAFIGNYHGIPTDCPHREKIGWTGDAHLVAETGLFNYDMASSYTKWIRDFTDEQRRNGQLPGIIPTSGWGYTLGNGPDRERGYGPQWESAFIIIPWYVYVYCGDTRLLERSYGGFKQYVDYLSEHSEDSMINFGIDDHAPAIKHTGPEDFATGFYYYDTLLLSKIAGILGYHDDERNYAALAETIRSAYNRTLYDSDSGIYGSGSQTAQSAPLYFGIVDQDETRRVVDNLISMVEQNDNHLDTGVVGSRFLMNALVDHGHADMAYAIATQTTFPSWGDWMRKGANTLWQKWDDSMSRNHIMFGDIGAWLFKNVAGINPDPANPGFRHFTVKPILFDGIDWAEAEHESPYGSIRSAWKKYDGSYELTVTVPVNTKATVMLPVNGEQRATERGNADGNTITVIFDENTDGIVQAKIGSGTYHFIVE